MAQESGACRCFGIRRNNMSLKFCMQNAATRPNKMLTVKNGQQKCISFHIFPHVPLCKNCFCEVVNGQPCQDVPWKLYWHTSKALAMGMDRQRSHTHPQLATGK
jgi:hypothetical protein